MREREHGPNHLSVAKALNNLAVIYSLQVSAGKYMYYTKLWIKLIAHERKYYDMSRDCTVINQWISRV